MSIGDAEGDSRCSDRALLSGDGRGVDFRAVWQLTSMSLGVGLFAIPYCFEELGVLLGGVLVVVLGFCANTAIERLLDCAATHCLSQYEDIANHAFGKAGQAAMAAIIAITTLIASLSYLSAATELLVCVAVAFLAGVDIDEIGGSGAVLTRVKRMVVLFVLVCISMPRLLKRSMGDNAFISTGSVFAMSFAAVVFVASCVLALVEGCHEEPCPKPPPLVRGNLQDVLENVATLAFSFSMVFAVFPVLSERAIACGSVGAAVKPMRMVVRLSITFSVCIYLLVGGVGVFAFGSDIRKLALTNVSLEGPREGLAQVTFMVVGLCSLLLVAIVGFPTIGSIELLYNMAFPASQRDVRPAVVCVVGLVCVLVDAFIDTKIAFALTGALGLSLGAYVMPCLLYLKLRDPASEATAASRQWRLLSSCLVLLFGAVVLLGGTPATVLAALDAGKSGPTKSLADLICQKAWTAEL